MKFKSKLDEIQFKVLGLTENVIKKRILAARDHIKDRKKQRDAKNNWRRNKHKIKKGMNKWHKSTKGKRFHKSLGRFNALREDTPLETINIRHNVVTEGLMALATIETHLLIELKFYEPDFEALSEFLLITESFLEESVLIKNDLLEAYTSGAMNSNSYNELIDIIQEFLDPKSYLLIKRSENGLSNDVNEDLDDHLNELNNCIENNTLKELYDGIDNLFTQGK